MPPELLEHVATFVANVERMRLGRTCRALRHLTVDHTHWGVDGARLERMGQLQVLHGVPYCDQEFPNALPSIQYALWRALRWTVFCRVPYLRELDLSCSTVDDLDMCGIAEFTQQLEILDLVDTQVKFTHWLLPVQERPADPDEVWAEALAPESPHLPPLWGRLHTLRLGCRDGQYYFSAAVGHHVPRLQTLVIRAADYEGYWLASMPSLRYLCLDGLQAELHDGRRSRLEVLHALFLAPDMYAQLPPTLTHLHFAPHDCDGIENADWLQACAEKLPLQQCPLLKELVVW